MIHSIIQPLVSWYESGHRDLPWRNDPTPYHVWISEIMLQQTRVEAVKPYYHRFLQELPTIADLANASSEQLLKLWEGLGYYSRIRNMQQAAIQIQEDCGGEMPRTFAELLQLKGIGRYTAGAVSSICFGAHEPAVDGNVLRVLSRVRMDERCISDAKVKLAVEQELREAMQIEKESYYPGNLNQSLMELGACVCIPTGAPKCDICPLAHLCSAHAEGVEQQYPVKAQKKARKLEERTILLLKKDGKYAISKRPEKGLLAGLYELPSLTGFCNEEQINTYLQDNGYLIQTIRELPKAKHIFTHIEWHMIGYEITIATEIKKKPERKVKDSAAWIFATGEEIADHYPIPSAFEAYARHMKKV